MTVNNQDNIAQSENGKNNFRRREREKTIVAPFAGK